MNRLGPGVWTANAVACLWLENHKAQTLKILSLIPKIPSPNPLVHSKGFGSLPEPGLHFYMPSQETLGTRLLLPVAGASVKYPQATDSHKKEDQPQGEAG